MGLLSRPCRVPSTAVFGDPPLDERNLCGEVRLQFGDDRLLDPSADESHANGHVAGAAPYGAVTITACVELVRP
jgi:hypothetical protein